MLRFSLLRLELSRYGVEVSVGEILTNTNSSRPLIGLGWSFLSGFRFGLLYFKKWTLALSPGVRILDASYYHQEWETELFGRFNFNLIS